MKSVKCWTVGKNSYLRENPALAVALAGIKGVRGVFAGKKKPFRDVKGFETREAGGLGWLINLSQLTGTTRALKK
jgi:hypothetical protein